MIGRLLCRLGLHAWRQLHLEVQGLDDSWAQRVEHWSQRVCRRCGAVRLPR